MKFCDEKKVQSYDCKKVEKTILSDLIKTNKEKNEKPFIFDDVTYFTMNRLVKRYDLYLESKNEEYSYLTKAMFTAIITLLSASLSIHMFNNLDILKEHICQFITFGVLTPIVTSTLTVKNVKEAHEKHENSISLLNQLNDLRRDIPFELIEKRYEKYNDEELELMKKNSPDSKLEIKLRNGLRKLLGE